MFRAFFFLILFYPCIFAFHDRGTLDTYLLYTNISRLLKWQIPVKFFDYYISKTSLTQRVAAVGIPKEISCFYDFRIGVVSNDLK